MDCRAHSSLYVKSNGDIPCSCATGEMVVLYKINHGFNKWFPEYYNYCDLIRDAFNGPVFTGIRYKLKNNKAPFGKVCETCCFFRPDDPFSGEDNFQSNNIRELQIEPSFLCNVNCYTCVPMYGRKKVQSGPSIMPFPVFEKVVSDIVKNNLSVERTVFAGRGEPFLNNNIYKMIRVVKSELNPHTAVLTNGNFDYSSELIYSGLDLIVFSLDGASPESYSAYRQGGDFKRALTFMKDIVKNKEKAKTGPYVVWKYILFEWNDSDAEIKDAQAIADEIKVDEIIFTRTRRPDPGFSKRFITLSDMQDKFPVISERTKLDSNIEERIVLNYKSRTIDHFRLESRIREIADKTIGRVILYGAGSIGISIVDMLKDCPSAEVAGFADSNIDKQNRSVKGLSVYPPEYLLDKAPDTIIIASLNYKDEIYSSIKFLEEKGIKIYTLI